MNCRLKKNNNPLPLNIGLHLAGWNPTTNLERAIEYWNFDYENAVPKSHSSSAGHGQTGDEDEMIVTDSRGYNYIFKKLAEPFTNKVLLNKVVNTVEDTNDGYYKVKASDGSCYKGKQVLITFSSNVLASKRISFKPDLPFWKKDAFLMYPLGHYCKIFLEFPKQSPKQFWDITDHFMAVQRDMQEYSLWQNLNIIKQYKDKNLLVVTLTGDKCLRSQEEDDSTVQQDAMKVLRGLYGKGIPDPIGRYT